MKLRFATWNLNTWINRRNRVPLEGCWRWAEENIGADVMILTEAPLEPPSPFQTNREWAIKPGGFPGRSGWGTLIVGRGVGVERLTELAGRTLDTKFPGSLTAARISLTNGLLVTVCGIYLPYRKESGGKFIGHPSNDLAALGDDFKVLRARNSDGLIIAGDFNHEHIITPRVMRKLGRGKKMIDVFAPEPRHTFRKENPPHDEYTLDYVFVDKGLRARVISTHGGFEDYPESARWSDHAPLVVDFDL